MSNREWKVGERGWFWFVDRVVTGKVEQVDVQWCDMRMRRGAEWVRRSDLHPTRHAAQVAEAKLALSVAKRCLWVEKANARANIKTRERNIAKAEKRLAALRAKVKP